MLLKLETTLFCYEHNNKTLLCRVKVLTSNDNTNKKQSSPNTCRSLTPDQWKEFDDELVSWLVVNDSDVQKEVESEFCQYSIKPNLNLNIKKCKLGLKDFVKCLNPDDNSYYENDYPYVLDCILEEKKSPSPTLSLFGDENEPTPATLTHKSLTPSPTPSLFGEEYEPVPAILTDKSLSVSPLSYAPYTPSRTSRRSREKSLVYDGVDEDTYSPTPLVKHESINDIAQYRPAPICKRNISFETEVSSQLEVITETEDEQKPNEGYHRTLRNRSKTKSKKAFSEYVPQRTEVEIDIPAYKPSPIESAAKKNKKLIANDVEPIMECYEEGTLDDKSYSSQEDNKPSKEHEKKAIYHSKKNVGEFKTKKCSIKLLSCSAMVPKKNVQSPLLNDDKFKKAYRQENHVAKERKDIVKINKRQESPKNKHKSSSKPGKQNLSPRRDRIETYEKIKNTKRDETFNPYEKKEGTERVQVIKSYEKKKTIEGEEVTKSYEKKKNTDPVKVTNSYEKNKTNESRDVTITSEKKRISEREKLLKTYEKNDSDEDFLRRSVRLPSKPKRFIEEPENYEYRKKQKGTKLYPLKNRELFGTDDDDDDDFVQVSQKNKNLDDKQHSTLKTPKVNKKPTSSLSLSATPSHSSKKKRHDDDCKQEKASMTKWLGKTSSRKPMGSSSDRTSKQNHLLSKESTWSKYSKDISELKSQKRPKSPSFESMDIAIPSKKDFEMMRNKTKIQREENEKMKELLEKIHVPTPEKVDFLSLKDMTLTQLLDSYPLHKEVLDEVFARYFKSDHVKGNKEGLNHCFVINLIDQQLQLKMMQKLTDVYCSDSNLAHASVIVNALLPEWILCIFMEKYLLTRREALNQIQDQDAYKLYMDNLNDTTFL